MHQLLRAAVGATLYTVATQGVHALRRQAYVTANRYAAGDQKLHSGCQPDAAFELDHVRTRLHQFAGTAKGLFGGGIGAKGHVSQNNRAAMLLLHATSHAFGVVTHGVQCDWQGAVVALAHHA